MSDQSSLMDDARARAWGYALDRRSNGTDAQCAIALAIIYLADVLRTKPQSSESTEE